MIRSKEQLFGSDTDIKNFSGLTIGHALTKGPASIDSVGCFKQNSFLIPSDMGKQGTPFRSPL